MFSNVRVNQQIFALDKVNGILDVGTVCEEPKTRFSQQQPQSNQYGYPMPMQPPVQVVDLVIQTPTGRVPIKGLPMDKNVYDNDAKTYFVTEDKQLMLNELKLLKDQSVEHVKRTPFYKDMIGKCDRWVEMLDPEAAEKKRVEQRMATLEQSNAEQANMLRELMEQNRQLMQQLVSKNSEDKNVKSSKSKENA